MREIDDDCVSAIAAHLDQESEDSLIRAYELGRRALTHGLGVLDVLSLYESAQRELVLSAPAADQPRMAAAVANFFREFLGPFEMSFRGYREANGELKRLNEDLKAAYTELQAQQLQLVQSAKMASLGELVAGIAHEINNPLAFVLSHLNTVSACLEKLENKPGQAASRGANEHWDRARDRLHQTQVGAERIRNLVLRLRTFSRLDEGEQKYVSIRECVDSVLTILAHRLESRIGIETHVGRPDMVECFPSLLNQAIMNLVSNAIDAIEDRGTISITTGADGDSYVIVVADTGHGIPEHLRERVLEPFFTTKEVGQGTGLGLSITHSIARKHRGILELRAAEQGGTLAILRFPLKRHGGT
jgi:two-component system NtrC family sensor kinase